MWISTWTGWFIFFIVVQIIHFLGTWKLYQNAGRKAWEAAVPVYNAIVLLDIIKRPKWWVILLFLPIISPIMIMILWVDFIRSFGKRSFVDGLLVIVTLGFYIYYLNYVEKPAYTGPEKRKETVISALLFAVILATTIHTYFVQPMIVPTGSMESTIKIGDALFVSKNVYGTRLPITPVAVPFADLFSRNLFVEKLQLPYERIPGWQKVKKNDIVVFNFPIDSVFSPIDRKDSYVKRCVGEPGDIIEIKASELFVNNQKFVPKKDAKVQYAYNVISKTQFSPKLLKDQLDQLSYDPTALQNQADYTVSQVQGGFAYHFFGLDQEMYQQLKNNPNVISIEKEILPKGQADPAVFPKGAPWNRDWYGPLQVPKKGMTIELNLENLGNYIDVIKNYEGKNIKMQGNQLTIDGKPATKYTFTQDYYFMMGDNRDNSFDSRFFGFVPETHIIGKPFFTWANFNQIAHFEPKDGWRLERWFTVPNNDEPNKTSYLWIGGLILALFFGWDLIFRKKKDKKK
ncbi:signal peptidase I [Ornithobacterium rhinotracheale]